MKLEITNTRKIPKKKPVTVIAMIMTLAGVVAFSGCETGDVRLSGMNASKIRATFKVGKTSMKEASDVLGKPSRQDPPEVPDRVGIYAGSIVWKYRYQTFTWLSLVPFIPDRWRNEKNHFLTLVFDGNNMVDYVEYHDEHDACRYHRDL